MIFLCFDFFIIFIIEEEEKMVIKRRIVFFRIIRKEEQIENLNKRLTYIKEQILQMGKQQ